MCFLQLKCRFPGPVGGGFSILVGGSPSGGVLHPGGSPSRRGVLHPRKGWEGGLHLEGGFSILGGWILHPGGGGSPSRGVGSPSMGGLHPEGGVLHPRGVSIQKGGFSIPGGGFSIRGDSPSWGVSIQKGEGGSPSQGGLHLETGSLSRGVSIWGGCPSGGDVMWPIPSCIWCYLFAASTPTEWQHLCSSLYSVTQVHAGIPTPHPFPCEQNDKLV